MTNLTITTLKNNPEFLNSTLALIEKSFDYSASSTFATDFFSLINPKNHHHCYLLLKDGKLIGHVGLKSKIFIHQTYETNIGFIGGIAIEESERGNGMFNYLMNEILNIHKKDFSFFMLWSDKAELYEKYGFYLGIGQISVTGKGKNHGLIKTKFHLLGEEKKQQIKTLYNEHILKNYFTIKRDDLDWEDISAITSADLFLRKEGKRISAYCFQNKGKDLTGITYEIAAGEDKEVKDFIDSTDFTFWLSEKYIDSFPGSQMLFASLVKIGNQELFTDFIEYWSDGEIHINRINKDEVTFLFEDAIFNLSHKDFICALFGPYPIKEFAPFNKFFFISGLDSI